MQDVGKPIVAAFLGGFAGILGTLQYVEEGAKEEQRHASKLEAHTENLKSIKETAFYAMQDRKALDARIKTLELQHAKEK